MANKCKKTDPPKNPKELKAPKKDTTTLEEKKADNNDDDDDEEEGDLEEMMEGTKAGRKRVMASVYKKVAETGQYVTMGEHRESCLLAHRARVEKQEAEAAAVETEKDAAQRQMESDLAWRERQRKLEEEKKEREKAKTFSKEMNERKWKPKTAISVIDDKKKKKIKKLRNDTKSG